MKLILVLFFGFVYLVSLALTQGELRSLTLVIIPARKRR
jgi:hypothetical protein